MSDPRSIDEVRSTAGFRLRSCALNERREPAEAALIVEAMRLKRASSEELRSSESGTSLVVALRPTDTRHVL